MSEPEKTNSNDGRFNNFPINLKHHLMEFV